MKEKKKGELTYWVSFASSMASSSVLNVFTQITGPNISSFQTSIEVFTSVMMVGSIKYPFFKCCKSITIYVFMILFKQIENYFNKIIYLRSLPTIQNGCTFTFGS